MTKTEIKTLAATKTWGRGRVYESIAETIGHTPLVRLSRIKAQAKLKADILLKLEFFNPLSSVKDRIGVAMIDVLEAEGRITPGKTRAHRADLRQYRHRLGLRRRGPRLPAHPRHAGDDVDGAAQDPHASRRRVGADARTRRHADGAGTSRRAGKIVPRCCHSRPVR